MKLSIIIVNYKSWGHLQNAMDALRPEFPKDWEIIVVDNESDPVDFAAFKKANNWIQMIANPVNSGFGPGCTIGVAAAQGVQLLFMNPDVVATSAQIQALLDEKRRVADIGLLSPKQVGKNGKPQKVFDEFPDLLNQSKTLKALRRILLPQRKPDPRADHRKLVWCDWITGSCLLIDRSDFDAIGGWSPDYWMYVEDADLCRRAQDTGLRVAYTPSVQIMHAHGGSSRINIAVKSMTKIEVVISKHVYASKHSHGLSKWLTHALIIALRLPGLTVMTLADALTLRRVTALRVRSRIFFGLLDYYRGAIATRSWLSPRLRANAFDRSQA